MPYEFGHIVQDLPAFSEPESAGFIRIENTGLVDHFMVGVVTLYRFDGSGIRIEAKG